MNSIHNTGANPPTLITEDEMDRIFQIQLANESTLARSTAKERRKKLKKLLDAILDQRETIKKIIHAAYGKPYAEIDLTEVYTVTSAIKHTRRNLRFWMSDQRVGTPISILGSTSRIQYEAKGVSLIIAPWNFPFMLVLNPLISAIAAGCPVVIKPSEMTPNVAMFLRDFLANIFPENEVAVIEGGIDISTHLLSKPFRHIFFTGSPAVGRIVMTAAAKNLSSVTLELGGKSPAIIDRSANLKRAARRIIWSKFMNAGQVCVAPDYLLVHRDIESKFIAELKKSLDILHSKNPRTTDTLSRIVNEKHFLRLSLALENAIQGGAKIIKGGSLETTDQFIAPTLLSDVPLNAELLGEEIFGPILPIITYATNEEAIAIISKKNRPLALYIFSRNKKTTNYFLSRTKAGSTAINIGTLQFFNHNLPFGGVGYSGMGKAHGWYGFKAFSNERALLKQHIPSFVDLLMPPFKKWKQRIIDLTIRWL